MTGRRAARACQPASLMDDGMWTERDAGGAGGAGAHHLGAGRAHALARHGSAQRMMPRAAATPGGAVCPRPRLLLLFLLPQDAARVPVREPFLALLSERARDGVVKSARVPKHHRWFLVLGTLAPAAAQKPLLYSSDEAENRSLLRALKTRNTGRLADQPPTFFERKINHRLQYRLCEATEDRDT